jgi:hypothetical protein
MDIYIRQDCQTLAPFLVKLLNTRFARHGIEPTALATFVKESGGNN